MSKLVEMLRTSAIADKAKAILSLELLENRSVGIGDHSTTDFYNNAEDALRMLIDADDRIQVLAKYFVSKSEVEAESDVKNSKGSKKEQLNG